MPPKPPILLFLLLVGLIGTTPACLADYRVEGPKDALQVFLETRQEGEHAVVQVSMGRGEKPHTSSGAPAPE